MADLGIHLSCRISSSIHLLLLICIFFTVSQSHQETEFCDVGYDEYSNCRSPSKILIKGGTVVNAHHLEIADVYIEHGIIASVRQNIPEYMENGTLVRAHVPLPLARLLTPMRQLSINKNQPVPAVFEV